MKKDKLNLITRVGLIVGLLIISLSVAYYFVIFLPKKERARGIHWQIVDSCLKTAETRANDYWNKVCEEKQLGDDCSLPKYNADVVKEYLNGWKDDCFKKYSIK